MLHCSYENRGYEALQDETGKREVAENTLRETGNELQTVKSDLKKEIASHFLTSKYLREEKHKNEISKRQLEIAKADEFEVNKEKAGNFMYWWNMLGSMQQRLSIPQPQFKVKLQKKTGIYIKVAIITYLLSFLCF